MTQLIKTSFFITVFSLIFSFEASAKIPIFFQTGAEHIYKVQDLPDTEFFRLESGQYLDLGVFSKQFTIFFIPLWNYDVKWCGYVGNDEEYMSLQKEQLDQIAKEAGITIDDTPSLPFWPSMGGKLLVLAIIGGFIAWSTLSSNEEEEEEEATPQFGNNASNSEDAPKA